MKAQGDEVRIIAGAAEGGAALVVQPDGRITKPEDFRGKAIATPQMGNTQDVACRAWLRKQGYRITQIGGDVKVLPAANPDQLSLFASRQIDGVWTVEPWVSRLELEAKGKVYLEQKDAIVTVLVSSAKLLKEKPALVKKFAAAHAELTDWINTHPDEAKKLVNAALKEITKREMSAELIDHAWPRLHFTSAIKKEALEGSVADAKSVGFLRDMVDLSRLVVIP
jgi:NitT/TauT family transport system substrate-binding protein